MSEFLENLNGKLIKNYYNSLKKSLNKINITNYDNDLECILSDENYTDTETTSAIFSENTNCEEFYYKKPWNKLNIIHKKIKIKEFVNKLIIKSDEKQKLNKKLINLLNDKKLNKKDDVDYDSINGKIISISILKCKNNEYYI